MLTDLLLDAATHALAAAIRYFSDDSEDGEELLAELEQRYRRLVAAKGNIAKLHSELDAMLAERKLPAPETSDR
jgi:phosphatidylserine/phosphatidylglycerophosphate/cardiolipin synthase-like enzyme